MTFKVSVILFRFVNGTMATLCANDARGGKVEEAMPNAPVQHHRRQPRSRIISTSEMESHTCAIFTQHSFRVTQRRPRVARHTESAIAAKCKYTYECPYS